MFLSQSKVFVFVLEQKQKSCALLTADPQTSVRFCTLKQGTSFMLSVPQSPLRFPLCCCWLLVLLVVNTWISTSVHYLSQWLLDAVVSCCVQTSCCRGRWELFLGCFGKWEKNTVRALAWQVEVSSYCLKKELSKQRSSSLTAVENSKLNPWEDSQHPFSIFWQLPVCIPADIVCHAFDAKSSFRNARFRCSYLSWMWIFHGCAVVTILHTCIFLAKCTCLIGVQLHFQFRMLL